MSLKSIFAYTCFGCLFIGLLMMIFRVQVLLAAGMLILGLLALIAYVWQLDQGKKFLAFLSAAFAYMYVTYYVCTETEMLWLQILLCVIGAAAFLVCMFIGAMNEGTAGAIGTGVQMAMKKCPNCMGKLSSKWGTTCPHCNSKLPSF